METMEYKGYKISIIQDEVYDSPRDWDNLGTMICFHRRYSLGDKHTYKYSEEIQFILDDTKNYISLPLYLYDHSGLSMSTSGFPCQWDSGQVGIIYVDKAKILKEYNAKRLTKKLIDKVLKVLKSEVETYNQYLQGDVWGFKIEREIEVKHCTSCDHALNDSLEEIESCWGFYGYDCCLNEAKSIVDNLTKKTA